jgi:hypothetical protein
MTDNPDNLYDFVLPSGVKLGDATPDDLLKAVKHYEERAVEAARKERWIRSVYNAMTKAPAK